MKPRLPSWFKGKRPKASDFQQINDAIAQLFNLTVDGAYGLQLEWTANGPKLSLIPRPLFAFAVVTGSDIPAYNASTKTDGKGTGILDVLTYNATTGNCVHSATTPNRSIVIYNGGKDPIVVGRRVGVYEERPGRWHAIVEYCV